MHFTVSTRSSSDPEGTTFPNQFTFFDDAWEFAKHKVLAELKQSHIERCEVMIRKVELNG